MLVPVRVCIDDNEKIGWCVYDTDNMCMMEDLGVYQTAMECNEAIHCYLEEL